MYIKVKDKKIPIPMEVLHIDEMYAVADLVIIPIDKFFPDRHPKTKRRILMFDPFVVRSSVFAILNKSGGVCYDQFLVFEESDDDFVNDRVIAYFLSLVDSTSADDS